jgi:succinate dehydrogenase / fumarate reductase cytochrome b subunit
LASWSRERAASAAKKLFSLTGVVPIGVFVMLHVGWYARALSGREALEAALVEPSPLLFVLEVLFVWLPLAYHGVYGTVVALSKQSLGQEPYVRRSVHFLQRLSGLVVFAFLVYHGWQLRAPLALGSMTLEDVFPTLVSSMSSTTGLGVPLVAIVYLVGSAATAFHLARGLLAVCSTWGLLRSERSATIAAWACGLLGVALFCVVATTVIYLASGSHLLKN